MRLGNRLPRVVCERPAPDDGTTGTGTRRWLPVKNPHPARLVCQISEFLRTRDRRRPSMTSRRSAASPRRRCPGFSRPRPSHAPRPLLASRDCGSTRISGQSIARALPTGKTAMIALVVSDVTNPVYFDHPEGEAAAAAAGCTVVLRTRGNQGWSSGTPSNAPSPPWTVSSSPRPGCRI